MGGMKKNIFHIRNVLAYVTSVATATMMTSENIQPSLWKSLSTKIVTGQVKNIILSMFSPEVLNLFSLSPEKNCQALHRCHNIFKKSNFFLFRRQLAAAKKMVVLVSLDAQDSSLERNTVINETLKKSERETSWKEKNKVKSEVKIPK